MVDKQLYILWGRVPPTSVSLFPMVSVWRMDVLLVKSFKEWQFVL